MLFYYLCDLIVYEQFFWNDLPADCLSKASCSGNGEKIVNGYTIRSIRNKITKNYFMSFAAVGIVISITRERKV